MGGGDGGVAVAWLYDHSPRVWHHSALGHIMYTDNYDCKDVIPTLFSFKMVQLEKVDLW